MNLCVKRRQGFPRWSGGGQAHVCYWVPQCFDSVFRTEVSESDLQPAKIDFD